MTTGAISGQALTLSIGGKLIAGSKNFAVSFSQATINTTSRDDAFTASFLAGHREWTIDIDAKTPQEAAKKALKIQRDRRSSATVFHVKDGRKTVSVDLDAEGALFRS